MCSHEITNVERLFAWIFFDNGMSWVNQISRVCNKLSKTVYVLYKASSMFDSDSVLLLYNVIFLPYLNYFLKILGTIYITHLKPIEILQNRAIRTIIKVQKRSNTSMLFKKINLLKFKDIVKLKCI